MANCMQLEIVTPDKLLFSSDEIVYLGLRTNDGGIGIEANTFLLLPAWTSRR